MAGAPDAVMEAAATIAQTREALRAQFAPPSSLSAPAAPLAPAPTSTSDHASNGHLDAAPQTPPDPSDLPAVWAAVRRQLVVSKNGSIDVNLGSNARLQSFDPGTGEVVLAVAAHMSGYAGERVRVKIEEAFAAVLARALRLVFVSTDEFAPASRSSPATGTAGAPSRPTAGGSYTVPAAPRRVPPELESAVRNQPIVMELMKRLDAKVVSVELLNTEA